MLQIVIICAITGDLDNICTGIDSIPLQMLSKSPGVNLPSTIPNPNPIPIEFFYSESDSSKFVNDSESDSDSSNISISDSDSESEFDSDSNFQLLI